MDITTTIETPSGVEYRNLDTDQQTTITNPPPLANACERQTRHCLGNADPGEFTLSASPCIVLHILSSYNLEPQDLAMLEVTCSFFRRPAQYSSHDFELSLSELAAYYMCQMRAIFRSMSDEQKQELKKTCGGSWKLVLRFLLAGEKGTRREKAQAVAGPGHSIVVNARGQVYSFGSNNTGQLGHGTTDDESKPRLIRSLQGIRIIQASVGDGQTMLVSDAGKVYAFGKSCFGDAEKFVTTPKLVEGSLNDIFVVQVTIGHCLIAVLSREGKVYTFFWGNENKHGHATEPNDYEPRPLLGALENLPVVQIAAGFCFLLALVCQPSGMSVYSVGCGLGGKLGHGTYDNENQPRLIEHFQTLNLEPIAIAAGDWHSVVLGKDGRVCTWGWASHGCLGHGNEVDSEQLNPKVIEALSDVKAVHVAAGVYTTFVVSENGDAYSFGSDESSSLGDEQENVRQMWTPELVTSIKQANEKVIRISASNCSASNAHTLALTQSGKVYAFGVGENGQLGVQLAADQTKRAKPERVIIDLA
ncbi:hypothetical protein CASFOL_025627 [Castilleja foliolosa]|uniref:RCC1-like domain-containing protein n=1 Tax=Castilleja foliolosa TaxID=1961234 RepID=A0ABD3CSJ0_9LAMI